MWILHKCDNPFCYNIDHLFLGTHHDNMADMKAKQRQKKSKKFTIEDAQKITESNLSQRKLAKIYGCSQAMIWLIQQGKRVWDGQSQQ